MAAVTSPALEPATAAEAFDSPCRARAVSQPSSALLRLRDELAVVTRARFDCVAPLEPFHLAIVADGSAIRSSPHAAWTVPAVRALGEDVRLDLNTAVRVGALEFSHTVETLCDPVADPDLLRACLDRLGAPSPPVDGARAGDVALGAAVVQATHHLARIRHAHAGADAPREMLLILVDPSTLESAADPVGACEDSRRAIAAADRLGIGAEVICLADTCRKDCVQDFVDPDSIHFKADWPDIESFVVSEAWASELRARHLVIHERLGSGFRFVVDSPDPGGATYDPIGHTLDWRTDVHGRRSIHLSYNLAARAVGSHAIRDPALGSFAQFTDTRGGVGTFDLGNAVVGVVERDFHTLALPWIAQPECDLCLRPDGRPPR